MFNSKKAAKKGLNIIIVGCGKVGATLTEQLSNEGHNITLIDNDADKMQTVAEAYDVMGIVGNGASYTIQMEAGIKDTDLLIAVTGSDELNLLCCTIANQAGDCATIARVRTPDYSKDTSYLREKLGLAMIINPELEAASEAARVLYLPTALNINTFAHGHAEMVTLRIPEGNKMDGQPIVELAKDNSFNVLICAVRRGEDIFIPSGNFVLKSGDIVSFVATRQNVRTFLQKVGFPTNQVKDTMIIGGGKAAYYLAKQLLAVGISVKIIEQSRARCEELSILLPDALIINGDGTDEDLLREEGIEQVEAFVPLTGIDEENVMLTLHAKNVSNAKVITKINRITFKNVINNLDLGSVIYPKYITAEAIIAYVRAKKATMDSNIETLYHIWDSTAEAIEFVVDRDSKVTNVSLFDLPIRDNLLIALITRAGKPFIPTGTDCIQVGDSVVVVTTHTCLNSIDDIVR